MSAQTPPASPRSSSLRARAAAALVVLSAAVAGAQTITDIGLLPGVNASNNMIPTAISADGSAVVGYCTFGTGRSFRWTKSDGSNFIFLPLFPTFPIPEKTTGVSADGSVVSGYFLDFIDANGAPRIFRYNLFSGDLDRPGFPFGTTQDSRGISGDGLTLIGTTPVALGQNNGPGGFLWTSVHGGTFLADIFGQPSGTPYATTYFGDTVAGSSNTVNGPVATLWTNSGQAAHIISGEYSAATAVSGDGAIAAGWLIPNPGDPNSVIEGVRWQNQVLQVLGPNFQPGCISMDGATIGGDLASGGGEDAAIWRQDVGIVDLNTYLPTLGVDLTGWHLISVVGISMDGTVLTGIGTHAAPPDDPGVFFRGFVIDLNKDSDGDGLSDDWEINGIPYMTDTGAVHRYILPGANPLRKDIYVEVDCHAGQAPTPATLGRVVAAFDASPVPAVAGLPGGLAGISLHVDIDETNLPSRAFAAGPGGMGWEDFHLDKSQFFGTPAERSSPEWDQMQKAKAKAYRYCIFAHNIPDCLGRAELVIDAPAHGPRGGTNDFMIGLGLHTPPPGRTLEDNQAAAFMHELGHTLGLYHGGGLVGQNFNPNHYSIMNYLWAGVRVYSSEPSGLLLDYSRAELPTLNESALDESLGIQGIPGVFVPTVVRTQFTFTPCGDLPASYGSCQSDNEFRVAHTCVNIVPMNGPVDWNNDGIISPPGHTVCADPNGMTASIPGETIISVNEWALLAYNFRDSPYFSDLALPTTEETCPSEDIENFLETLPPAPANCPASPPIAGSTQPASVTASPHADVPFSIAPTVTGPVFAQWRWFDQSQSPPVWRDLADGQMANGTQVSGSQEATVHLISPSPDDFGGRTVTLSCHITDQCGQVSDSDPGTLLIGGAGVSLASPQLVPACPGGSATFAITATSLGNNLSYQWISNVTDDDLEDGPLDFGTLISGSTTPTLTLTNIHAEDFDPSIGQFFFACVVNDGVASVTSDLFRFTPNGILLVENPLDVNLPCTGTPQLTLTAGAVAIGPVSYQWSRNGTPISDGGRVSGTHAAILEIANPQQSDAGRYVCNMSANCGSTSSAPARVDIGLPSLAVDPPTTDPTCFGVSTTISVDAFGSGNLTYQWMRNGADLADGDGVFGVQTPVLFVNSVDPDNLTSFQVRITGDCGSYVSGHAQIAVYHPIAIATQPIDQHTCATGTTTLSVQPTEEQPNLDFIWQVEDPANPGSWIFVDDGPGSFALGSCAVAAGSRTRSITIVWTPSAGCPTTHRFRALLDDPCEQVPSDAVTVTNGCNADFNCDGDVGTDADIENFFSCLAGSCCPTCGTADFNGDGEVGTDADIEAFFRVLAGGPC